MQGVPSELQPEGGSARPQLRVQQTQLPPIHAAERAIELVPALSHTVEPGMMDRLQDSCGLARPQLRRLNLR
eukprot:CAMPEP_0173204416 /NCGR_PEP_ID=MMETSP1141-20130122/20105_1 /TAXON_ID=483371 /ORGANISM="non described non described, Strain CCMP2298" /LENGTH=71 /DNA_ID=CAMNT_0014130067 /DNA_START=287 /DNA_END=502 /DNA_ORIENTATION=-